MKKVNQIFNRDLSGGVYSGRSEADQEYNNCTFETANLKYMNLSRITFNNCIFKGATFEGSRVVDCVFKKCTLESSILDKVKFTSTMFLECKFDGASLVGIMHIAREVYFDPKCSGLFSTKGPTFNLSVLDGWQPVGSKVTRKFKGWKKEVKPEDLDPDMLVDPVHLPPVPHYRSAPTKIPAGLKKKAKTLGHYDDQKHYYHGYKVESSQYRRYWWGFDNRAVLECSDIELFRKINND